MAKDDASTRDISKTISDRVHPYIERLTELYESDRALARALGIEASTLSNILRKKQNSTFPIWLKVARLTGLGFWFLTGVTPPPEDKNPERVKACARAFLNGYSLKAIASAREHVTTHTDETRSVEEWEALIDRYERGQMSGGTRLVPRR